METYVISENIFPTMKSQKTGSESSSASAETASGEAEPAVNVHDPKAL